MGGAVISPAEPSSAFFDPALAVAWLETAPRALAFVDAELTLIWMNAAARVLLSRSRALHRRANGLAAEDAEDLERLKALVADCARGGPADVERIDTFGRVDGADRLLVRARVLTGPAALVGLVLEPMAGRRPPPLPDLHRTHGVTPAEQAVVEVLLQGFSSQEIADRLNLSVFTVRTHLKHAYDKLGVTSKEQLFVALFAYMTARD